MASGRRGEGETARMALVELGAVDGDGWLRQSELARRVGVASARMSLLVAELLAGGYIEKRSAGVRLSEDGKSVLALMAEHPAASQPPARSEGDTPQGRVRRVYVSRGQGVALPAWAVVETPEGETV